MCTEKSDLMIKETLKSLCCNNGWSYGVFWGFDQRNSLLLTLQDAYYEEQMGAVIDNMLLQVLVLGGGLIGQAAYAKHHLWMFSDAHFERQNSFGSIRSLDAFQDDFEFCCQFSIGIKTIAVISVEPFGVVQFGSIEKIPESKEFVVQVKQLFRGIGKVGGFMLSENATSASDNESFGSSRQCASLVSCESFDSMNHNSHHGAYCDDLINANLSSATLTQSFSSTSHHHSTNSLVSLFENQIQISSKISTQLQQSLLEPATYFDIAATQEPCATSGDSLATSSWQHLPSVMRENASFAKPKTYKSCTDSSLNMHMDSSTTSLNSQNFSGELLNDQNSTPLLHSTNRKSQRPSSLITAEELFRKNDSGPVDSLSPWFSSPRNQSSISLATICSNDTSHAAGFNSVANFGGLNSPINVSDNLPISSIQSSLTDPLNFCGKEKCSGMSGFEKLFDDFGMDSGCKKPEDWNEILVPVVNSDNLGLSSMNFECLPEQYAGSRVKNSNSLFSQLGLDHILDGGSFARSRYEDQLSLTAKRRKAENYSRSNDQVKFQGLPSFDGKTEMQHSKHATNKTNVLAANNEALEADSWIGGRCSMNAGKDSSPKGHEQSSKNVKKKAKPGTRPRPKDRQQIQDRLAELRELIPNGEKMSIDRLLERTIKHLDFMQSLTKHAKSLEKVDRPKEDNSSSSSIGVTWACEVGDQTMVCPLLVEDLSTPGQMLVEILFEEQSFFLEIVDIIRGFGLTILKGVMEDRKNKIWSHFIVEVEGNRYVTRHEVFSSLVQLLQMTGPSGASSSYQHNTINAGPSVHDNCQQPDISLPVDFVDTLQCANL